jgi:hypothetical protein
VTEPNGQTARPTKPGQVAHEHRIGDSKGWTNAKALLTENMIYWRCEFK